MESVAGMTMGLVPINSRFSSWLTPRSILRDVSGEHFKVKLMARSTKVRSLRLVGCRRVGRS